MVDLHEARAILKREVLAKGDPRIRLGRPFENDAYWIFPMVAEDGGPVFGAPSLYLNKQTGTIESPPMGDGGERAGCMGLLIRRPPRPKQPIEQESRPAPFPPFDTMDGLDPTRELFRRAYPDGLPEKDYFPLLAILYPDMSDRQLAKVVAEFFKRDYDGVLNDGAKAVSTQVPSKEDLERVRLRLLLAGHEDWKKLE